MPRKAEYMDPYVTVSRQRRWQMKRAALGECRQCGCKLPLTPYPGRAAFYCPTCYGKVRELNCRFRAAQKAKRAAKASADDVI